MAHTTHLYKVNATYYFRIRIPSDLKEWFGKQDFKRSLRTKSLTSARRLVMLWASKTEKLFTTIRAGMISGMMTGKQIKKLIEDYISYTLKKDDEKRVRDGVKEFQVATPEGIDSLPDRALFDPDRECIIEELEQDQFGIVAAKLSNFLETQGVEIDRDTYEYKVLCRDIARAHIEEIHQVNVDRDMGNFDDKYYLNDGDSEGDSAESVPQASPEVDGLLLSELTEKYLNEKDARGNQSEGTRKANERYFALFLELLGDVPVKSITRDQVVECLTKMRRIPSRREVMPEYKGKTITELIQLKNVKNPLGTQTIKNHVSTLSSCFKWGVLNGYMLTNIAEGLTPKDNRSKREKRQAYTMDLIQTLTDALYTKQKCKGKSPDYWLIPLVALHSGMRIEEICQLKKGDIKQIKGVWCFDVYASDDSKVKTDSGERIVPVHPKLIEYGFLEYHKSITDSDQLWPRLYKSSGKWSHKWGQWFQSWNRRNVTEDKRYVFHSLRHNFTNGLKQQGVQEQVIAEIVGHETGSVTMETYGKDYEPKVLLEAMKKLDYSVDFSCLKWE